MRRPPILPLLLALAASTAALLWLSFPTGETIEVRVPGRDRPAGGSGVSAPSSGVAAKLERFDGRPADLPGSWPAFRGLHLDNVGREEKGLIDSLGPEGPKVLWSLELGEGHASPSVDAGQVYLLDYDRALQADAYRAFSLADGREIWRYSYPVTVKRNHGMSRTAPAVTRDHVVGLGPKCHVHCLDARTGELRWQIDLVKEHKAKVPQWYAGQCPIIDGDRVILAPGGDSLLLAVAIGTGEVVWKTPNPRAWLMTHASILPIEVGGVRQYVYPASGGVVGVRAEDGAPLWETDAWTIMIATVPSAVSLGHGTLFLTGGYNAGSLFLEVRKEGDRFLADLGTRLGPEDFGSPQQTPIFHEGHIYGVRADGRFACLDMQGRVLWTTEGGESFGYGPYIIADGKVFLLNDKGVLHLLEASPKGHRALGQAKILPGHDSWGPLVLVSGRLMARDLTHLVCLDVRKP